MEMVNLRYGLYDRSGTLLNANTNGAAGTLAALTGSSDNLSDPQVMWDPGTHRFYYVVLDTTDNHFLYGFSKGSAPQGSSDFCKYDLNYNYGSELPDYPKLGDSQDFMLIGANIFSGNTYVGSDVDWLAKPAVGTSTITTCPAGGFNAGTFSSLKNADSSLTSTPEPAQEADPNGSGWIVGTPDVSTGGSGNFISVFQVTKNTSGSATLSAPTAIAVATFSMPPNAPESGTSRVLDTLDGRLEHAVAAIDPTYNRMAIWTAHAVAGGAGSEERWYEIDPVGSALLQSGKATDPSLYVWNGAISPDRANNGTTSAFGADMVMGFNTSSSSTFPAIEMVSKSYSNAQSAFTSVFQSTAYDADFSCTGSSSTCRWGDYSGATPDPSANFAAATGTVWLSNEYDVANSSPRFHAAWRTYNWSANPGPGLPTVPGTLTVSSTTSSQISLSWGPSSGADSYVVERSTDGSAWSQIASPTNTTYTDSGLAVNTTYYYRVRGINPTGTGGYSNVLGASTLASCSSYPCAYSYNTTFGSDVPANAIDGNASTWWQPVGSTTTPTLTVDLGSPTAISAISTQWYSAAFAPSAYQIQTSTDGATWTTQLTVTGNTLASRTDALPATVTANYIQLVANSFTSATGPYAQIALDELGWDGHGVAFPIASSPNTTFSSDVPANAIDGNASTWWQPVGSTTTPTLTVDLGSPTAISAISTQWYSAAFAPSAYQIQTSTDGATWTTQLTVTGNTLASRTDALPATVTANYIQLVANSFTSATGPYAQIALDELGWQ